MTEYEKGQIEALEKLKTKLIGRVVNGSLKLVILGEDIEKLKKEIIEKSQRKRSAKGVF